MGVKAESSNLAIKTFLMNDANQLHVVLWYLKR